MLYFSDLMQMESVLGKSIHRNGSLHCIINL